MVYACLDANAPGTIVSRYATLVHRSRNRGGRPLATRLAGSHTSLRNHVGVPRFHPGVPIFHPVWLSLYKPRDGYRGITICYRIFIYTIYCKTNPIVRCTVNYMCSMYSVGVQYIYTVQCTIHGVQCSLYSIHCTLYNAWRTLIIYPPLYNVLCSVYSV